jgi:hypothetical protein
VEPSSEYLQAPATDGEPGTIFSLENTMKTTPSLDELIAQLAQPKKVTAYSFAVRLLTMSTILLLLLTMFVFVAKCLYWTLSW